MTPQNPKPVTLIGNLGKDRIERYTRARTYTAMVPDPILDGELVEREFTTRPRPYLKLSLATHGRTTTWHDLIVWSPDHSTPVQAAYLARKGDKVRVTGHFENFEFETEAGETRSGCHFVVQSFNFKSLVCRTAPKGS
ncbi:MAG: single-stranded DNA-binding protein [Acidobacteriota bacterium]|nr:single-stranded DNA-binding protein [Acidobacteriota bacterium]